MLALVPVHPSPQTEDASLSLNSSPTSCIHMTAYCPIANGLVEHLHCQLKASLKVQSDPTNWTDSLPMVLFGIRTAVKEDIHCTAAELMYGTTFHLHSQFFSGSSSESNLLHTYRVSRPPCSSLMLHLSVLIITLFTFLTASSHADMWLSLYTHFFYCTYIHRAF